MKRAAAVFGMVLAAMAAPISAQSGDGLTYVSTAFENTKATNSFTVTTQSATQIRGIPGGGDAPVMQTNSEFNVAGENVSGSLEMTSSFAFGGQAAQENKTAAEVVIVDGQTYIQFSDAPELPQGQGEGITIPEGWFNPEDLDEQTAGLTANIGQNIAGVIDLPITEESISDLKELDADTIDGQSMRVFQLTLNTEYIAENGVAGLFGANSMGMMAGGQGGFLGGAPFGQVTPPADVPTPDGTMQPPSTQDAQITLAVWIGDDDQLVHRVYSVIALAPGENTQLPISLQITTVTDFSNFNETFEIAAPEVEA